jgi:signal transduction histidine kinase
MTIAEVMREVEDRSRVGALARLGLLDTPAEPAFDRLSGLAARVVGAPVSLVSLVDGDRQFFKSRVGLGRTWSADSDGSGTSRTHELCRRVVAAGEPVIVDDDRDADGPDEGFAAYAGVPLTTTQGFVVGAFCALDFEPREWTPDEIATLEDLANAVMTEIELRAEVHQRREAERLALAARESSDAESRAKSDFLASMSHELRTPLNSIIGFSQLLMKNDDGNLTARQSSMLERIGSNGTHVLELINEILDLAKVEAGEMQLEPTSFCLSPLIHEILDDLEGQLRGKPVRLLAETPRGLEPVEADRGKMKQVLINLVGNAIKFTEKGSVSVVVTADRSDGTPRSIQIVDTGIGIPEDRQVEIFRPFRQAEPGTARRFGGTGLGLTLSRSLLGEMGYGLTLESVVGKGSTFTIDLTGTRSPILS